MKEIDLVNKILDLNLPKEETNSITTRYYNTVVKDDTSIKNLKNVFLSENDGIYFLKIQFYNWYAKGPCDIPYNLDTELMYFIFLQDKWEYLSLDEFLGLGSAKGLIWKQVELNVA
jgi:hypothetical protein